MSIKSGQEGPFSSLAFQMGQMMDQMKKGFFGYSRNETWNPNVNVYESDTAFVICVDLAGLDKEKIDLHVADGQLRLRGTRIDPALNNNLETGQNERWRVHLMEIDHGDFSRTVQLPDNVDPGQIAANYRNGMLWIEIPKTKK